MNHRRSDALTTAAVTLLIVAGSVVSAQAATCASSEADQPRGTIAFISDRDGSNQIYTVDTDGKNLIRLTNMEEAYIDDLDWSPDGRQLAFTAGTSMYKARDVYVLDTESLKRTRVTTNKGDDYGAVWSPDGQKIAYISDRGGYFDIWEMLVNGTQARQITDDPRWEMIVRWMPDGHDITFVPNSGADLEIWTGNDQILIPRPLVRQLVSVTDFRWSPDGEQLSLHTDDGAYLFNLNASELRLIEGRSTYAFSGAPSWSPDGCRLVFASRRDGNPELYTLDIQSGIQRRLTSNDATDRDPVWRPNRRD